MTEPVHPRRREGLSAMITNPGKYLRNRVPRTGVVLACAVLLWLVPFVESKAEPVDYNSFASLAVEAYVGWMEGRMGFEQEPNALIPGSLNDLDKDLGLPTDRKTLRLALAVRPLEHHLLRLYGSVPEYYRGANTTNRTLQTRRATYPPGTEVVSEMINGSFGFGYDLDFLVGPRWYAGFNGDLKYLYTKIRMSGGGVDLEDTLALNEMTPCLGAHVESKMPVPSLILPQPMTLGGFARMTYGMTPNFLNYVDISIGGSLDVRTAIGPVVSARIGYEHESFFHNEHTFTGRTFEFDRNGFMFSIAGAF